MTLKINLGQYSEVNDTILYWKKQTLSYRIYN